MHLFYRMRCMYTRLRCAIGLHFPGVTYLGPPAVSFCGRCAKRVNAPRRYRGAA